MTGNSEKGPISAGDLVMLRDLLDRMEPQLRLLEGTVAILRCLGETADSVDPVALAAVAHLGHGSLADVTGHWRQAHDLLKSQGSAQADVAG